MKTLLSLTLLLTCLIGRANDPLFDDVWKDSANWPTRVRLLDSSSLSTEPFARFTGMLVRIEGDVALVDFGRDGRQRVPVIETDIPVNAAKIATGELAKSAPNFIDSNIGKLVRPRGDTFVRERPEKLFEYDFFLLAYLNPDFVASDGFAEAADSISERMHEFGGEWLVISRETRAIAELKTMGRSDLMMVPHFALANWYAFEHNPAEDGATFVLIDANGKLLGRWLLQRPDDADGLDALGDGMRDLISSVARESLSHE